MSKAYEFESKLDLDQIRASKPHSGAVLLWMGDDNKKPFTTACDLKITGPRNMNVDVPAGFNYDGASVPSPLWWFIPRADARFFRAATLHDQLYAAREGSRAVADAILRIVAEQDRMPWLKRWAAYVAVRLFGRAAWDDDD